MKNLKRFRIFEDDDFTPEDEYDYFMSKSEKIIDDLKDDLTEISDHRYVNIWSEYDEVPILYISCELNNYLEFSNIDDINDFKEFSKEIIEIVNLIIEGLERSKVYYTKYSISFEDYDSVGDDAYDGPVITFKVCLDKKMLN